MQFSLRTVKFRETQQQNTTTTDHSQSNKTMASSITKDMPDGMIAVVAGPRSKSKVFHVEREVAIAKSAYFRDLLSRSKIPIVRFPEAEHEVIEGLVEWMREGTLGPLTPMPDENHDWTMPKIFEAYLLAKNIRLCAFKNELCDILRFTYRQGNTYPHPSNLRKAYDLGLQNEPVTKLLMMAVVYQIHKKPSNLGKGSANLKNIQDLADRPKLMQDLIAEITEFARNEWKNIVDEYDQEQICAWHDHSDGSSCRGGLGLVDNEAQPPQYEKT